MEQTLFIVLSFWACGIFDQIQNKVAELVKQPILLVLLASGASFSFKILQPFIYRECWGRREKLHDSGSYLN